MSSESVRDAARRLVEQLAPDATWEDVQYEIYVRQAIEAELKDSEQGRTMPLKEARLRFGRVDE